MKKFFYTPTIYMVVSMGILIALVIVCNNFLTVKTAYFEIGTAFIPAILIAYLYGPFYGGICLGIADILGTVMFYGGQFYFGWTITSILTGVIYGIFLFNHKLKLKNIIIAILIVSILFELVCNTLFLLNLYGNGSLVTLPMRLLITPVRIVIEVLYVYYIFPKLSFAKQKLWNEA